MLLGASLVLSAVLAVQDDTAADEAVDRFTQALKTAATPVAQATAITELARTPHEKTLRRIAPFLGAGAKETRVAAAKGLGNFKDYKKLATPLLMQALGGPNQKEPDVQVAIFEGLGMLADPVALQFVHTHFKHDYAKTARAAILAAGAMRMKESMDPLITLLVDIEEWLQKKQGGGYKDDKGQGGDEAAQKTRLEGIRSDVLKAFQLITKEKWTTSKEWQIWWSRRRATFEVPK
jgi:hypothetical protein